MKMLIKEPENRLGASNIHDLMRHKFFTGIDFETITTELPPERFILSNEQLALKKYLPKYRHANAYGSPLNKNNRSMIEPSK
jgi:hypothetical protein